MEILIFLIKKQKVNIHIKLNIIVLYELTENYEMLLKCQSLEYLK